jgi:hypothetical protein
MSTCDVAMLRQPCSDVIFISILASIGGGIPLRPMLQFLFKKIAEKWLKISVFWLKQEEI